MQNVYQRKSEKVDNEYTRKEITQQTLKSGLDQSVMCVTSIMEKDIGAYRVLHTDQNDMWVYNRAKGLTLYDEHFVQRKTIGLTSNIYDMALTASQDIIATDYDTKCVVKISPTGNVSTLCSTAPLKPYGICINIRQQLVVGLSAGLRTPPIKLTIYSSDGSTVLQEIENDEDGKPMFRNPITQVKQNGDGDYVLADGYYSILCVSSEGRFRLEYSEGLSLVSGIVCDKYDNVILAERILNKIHLLSSEGKLVTTLLTEADGISMPQSLSIDRHGQLWIGQDNNVKVVKYLK